MEESWKKIKEVPPPKDKVILTKIDDGEERNVQPLIFYRNLWFLPDKSIYVYYEPTHWKHEKN